MISNDEKTTKIIDFLETLLNEKKTKDQNDIHFDKYNFDDDDVFMSNKLREKENRDYREGDLTRKHTLQSLDTAKSETFFSSASIKEIKRILGDPTRFCLMSDVEKKQIQNKLTSLNKDEYVWKALTKRTVHDPGICHSQLYVAEYDSFKNALKPLVKSDKRGDSGRSSQKYLAFKAEKLVRGLSEFLSAKDNMLFNRVKFLTEEEFETILDGIEISDIFDDICRIVLKKAYDNTFNNVMRESRKYKNIMTDGIIVTDKNPVVYDLYIAMAMYYMNLTLNYLENKKEVIIDHNIMNKLVYRTLRHDQPFLTTATWWKSHCDGVRSVLHVFESCNVFTIINDTKRSVDNSVKTIQKYVVPQNMSDNDVVFTNLPRVIRADNLNKDSFEDKIKPIFKGRAYITFSDRFKFVMNTSKDKKYRINGNFLNLLLELYQMNEYSYDWFTHVELPFVTEKEVFAIKNQTKCLKEYPVLDVTQRYLVEAIKTLFAVNEAPVPLFKPQVMFLAGAFPLERAINDKIILLEQEYMVKASMRRWYATVLRLADIYQGFPIYITDSLCSRGRFYPEQPFISRTSGIAKHLLMEYEPTTLTLRGFAHMLRAYYKPCKQLYSKFEETFCTRLSKKNGMKRLVMFFKENPLNLSETGDKFLYFALLHMEILQAIETKKTSICLEIDQVASGVMLMSYLLKNRSMAERSNVVGGEKSDPYLYCRDRFSVFCEKHMENKAPRAVKFLSEDRKVHKYALMCFSYAQTHYGRIDDFIDRFRDNFGELSGSEKATLNEFALLYPSFVEYVFPGVQKQLEILYRVVSLAAKELGHLPFQNIQGEKFTWSFYKYKSTTRSAYDAITKRIKPYKSYKLDVALVVDDNSDLSSKKRLVGDMTTYRRKALSYFIHCIDASIIHRFIEVMKKKHNYHINHLHDCVLLHPNYVDKFYDCVMDLYSSDELYCISDNFFTEVMNRVSVDTAKKIALLRDEFELNSSDFSSDLKNVIPQNVYEFEG